MGNMRFVALFLVFAPLLISCDQVTDKFGNRYELTKDQSGRTIRLDKRTGELAVIDGNSITVVKDAAVVETERKAKISSLAAARYYPPIVLSQFNIQLSLQTSWQDGNALYSVTFNPIVKTTQKPESGEAKSTPIEKPSEQPDARLGIPYWPLIDVHDFILLLEDVPFELARQTMTLSSVVDSSNKRIALVAKGKIPMSSETYGKIDVWNVNWQRKYPR